MSNRPWAAGTFMLLDEPQRHFQDGAESTKLR